MKVSEADRNRFPRGGPLPGHSLGKSSLSQNDPLLRQFGVQSIEQGQMRILCARPPVPPTGWGHGRAGVPLDSASLVAVPFIVWMPVWPLLLQREVLRCRVPATDDFRKTDTEGLSEDRDAEGRYGT